MFNTPLFQRFFFCVAIVTALGILVHDTKFDSAVMLALPVTTVALGLSSHSFDLSGNAHTHVERASLSHAFTGIPRVQARDDHRKYLVQKLVGRNGHFGESGVIWPNI